MGADFDAGSIQATATIDLTPFAAGLKQARQQAEAFERHPYTATIDANIDDFDRKASEVEGRLDIFGGAVTKTKIDVDDAAFNAGMDAAEARLDAFSVRHPTANPNVAPTIGAPGLPGGGNGGLNVIAGAGGDGGSGGSGGGGLLAGALGLAAGLLPAIGPAVSAVTLFGTAAIAAFSGAATSLAGFGKVAEGVFPLIADATSGPLLSAKKNLDSLKKSWDGLIDSSKNNIGKLFSDSFAVAGGVLDKLAPLMNTIAKGLDNSVQYLAKLADSKTFDTFIKSLRGFMDGLTNSLGPAVSHVLDGVMRLFISFRPVMKILGDDILDITKQFDQWSKRMENGGTKGWLKDVKEDLPLLKKLVQDTFDTFVSLIKALAPAARPALQLLDDLVLAVGALSGPLQTIAPLIPEIAAGFAAMMVLQTVVPLVEGLGSAIAFMISPIGLVVAGLAALALIVVDAYKHSEPFRASIQQLGHDVMTLWNNFQPVIADLKGPLLDAFQGLRKFIENDVLPTLVAFGDWFIKNIVPDILNVVIPTIKALARTFTNNVLPAVQNFWDNGLKPLAKKMGPFIQQWADLSSEILQKVIPALATLGGVLTGAFFDDLTAAANALEKVFDLMNKINQITTGKGGIAGFLSGPLSSLVPGGPGTGKILGMLGFNANGTEDAPGGLSVVGENGPELAYLPSGSKVLTHQRTVSALKGAAGLTGMSSDDTVSLLRAMVTHLSNIASKTAPPEEMVDALSTAYADAQTATARRVIQTQRAQGPEGAAA